MTCLLPLDPVPLLPNILHLVLERLDNPRSDLARQPDGTTGTHLGRAASLAIVR